MSKRNTAFMGPPGICDACGRGCQGLHQAGCPCYHCKAGTFIHRGEWHYTPCKSCGADVYGCAACNQNGVVATRLPQTAATLTP